MHAMYERSKLRSPARHSDDSRMQRTYENGQTPVLESFETEVDGGSMYRPSDNLLVSLAVACALGYR
jgi:hypothetical protein